MANVVEFEGADAAVGAARAGLTERRATLAAQSIVAVRRIPPAWPLASTVAVNPYLGHAEDDLAKAAARLDRLGGGPTTQARSVYRAAMARGEITEADLEGALAACPYQAKPSDAAALRAAAERDPKTPPPLRTVAELAAQASGVDWPGIMDERFGAWASGRFDQGQALWGAEPPAEPESARRSAWTSWKSWATNDLTPELQGLTGFCHRAASLPSNAVDAIHAASTELGVTEGSAESYFHQALFSLGGWAQAARYQLWRAELAGGVDATGVELLAIRMTWDQALLARYGDQIGGQWAAVVAEHASPIDPSPSQIVDSILQEALERARQRGLAVALAAPAPQIAAARPTLQMAFCIDVRSEVFRRALEAMDPGVRTLGFAGFFGIATTHRDVASDVDELRLPVLLNQGVSSTASAEEPANIADEQRRRSAARAGRAWGRFKLAAVSSFAFVEAAAPTYIAKLLRDALSFDPPTPEPAPTPRLTTTLDLDAQICAAETVLRAMSLTSDFARVVILAGHGSHVANNPHASALQCGACGGYSGEVNARLLAQLLNDPSVRAGLVDRGVAIPADTLFLAALHDTASDGVTLYTQDVETQAHGNDIAAIEGWLHGAGRLTRAERARRLPGADAGAALLARAADWAEVRPEWGLAGCKAFIAAPRARTAGRDHGGGAFLHDYDWRDDAPRGYGVLELIMTAPVVVASWISLQYYGSSVAPETCGAGDKRLHNVVGGFGVVEGNGGRLRTGLPLQSVHDGARLAHEPLRLSVCIEAPAEAMTQVLAKHPDLRQLFDNRWLHLFALDETGRMAQRYVGGLEWEPIGARAAPTEDDLSSAA